MPNQSLNVVDGDTIDLDGQRQRLLNIDTAESVHSDSSRNTPEGEVASKFTKAILPSNHPEQIQKESFGKGVFGRELSNVNRDINGTSVDINLMLLDQEQSDYVNTYGNNPNPKKHEKYQNYMSTNTKFRLGEEVPLMDKENFDRMSGLHTTFEQAMTKFDDGEGSQEELDAAIVGLYSNEDDVVQYRQTLYELNAPSFDDGSLRYASDHATLSEEQLYMRNLAVANTGSISKTTFKLKLDQEGSAIGTAFSKFNSVANAMQWADMQKVRNFGKTKEPNMPPEQLLRGLDPQFHAQVTEEATAYGDVAAVELRNQIIQDVKDNTFWDNLDWYEQGGYGALAYIIDPLTVISGGAGGATLKAIPYAFKTAKTWTQVGANVGVSATRWASVGALEESARAGIRLAADETYTTKDAQMDIMVSLVAGGILPVVGHAAKGGAKKVFGTRWEELRANKQKTTAEFSEHKKKVADSDEPLETELVGDHQINSRTGEIVPFNYTNYKFKEATVEGEEAIVRTPENLVKVDSVSDAALTSQAKYYLRGMSKTDEEYQQVIADAGQAYLQRVDHSVSKGQETVKNYKATDQKDFHGMKKTLADWIGDTLSMQWAGNTFRDVATRFQRSGLDSLEFIGVNVTETGKGFSGKISRKHTAALIKDSEATRAQVKLLPQYNAAVREYTSSRGKGALSMSQAEWQGGVNKHANDFHMDVLRYQEARRLGKTVPDVHPAVARYADEWDAGFAYAHDRMVKAELPNFTPERRVKHYTPRQWQPHKLHGMSKQIGRANVKRLLEKAFKEMNVRQGTPSQKASVGADALMKNIDNSRHNKMKDPFKDEVHDIDDAFTPDIDLHSRERLDLDMTTSIDVNGKQYSLLDLINTELPEIATKYTERMSGYIGLSKSTGGAINNPLDVKTFRQTIKNEAMEKGKSMKDTNEALSMYDDVMDGLFGRPTRRFASEGTLSKSEQLLTGSNVTGISNNMRQLKDLTALTQLGALGAVQLGETGNAIVRLAMEAFSNPSALKALYKKSGVNVNDPHEMLRVSHEIMAQTGISKDIKYLKRQSVHLDQQRKAELSQLGMMADTVVDVATFGKHKAEASYALAKTTGFNAVRDWQNEIAQSAATVDMVKRIMSNTGKMTDARVKDLGLDGKHLVDNINKHVEVNKEGYPVAMNFDKWDDAALDDFTYGITRDAKQAVQQSMVGETPAYLSRPLMQVALQYMEMPIVAMNKQLGRQVAFADKESAVAMVLAGTVAGIIKYSWNYLSDEVTESKRQVSDVDSLETLVNSEVFKAVQYAPHLAYLPNILEHISGKAGIPIMSTLNNMAKAADQGHEIATGEGSAKDFIDTAHRLVPLGTTIYAEGVMRLAHEMADKLED